jgi:hypothetical protein
VSGSHCWARSRLTPSSQPGGGRGRGSRDPWPARAVLITVEPVARFESPAAGLVARRLRAGAASGSAANPRRSPPDSAANIWGTWSCWTRAAACARQHEDGFAPLGSHGCSGRLGRAAVVGAVPRNAPARQALAAHAVAISIRGCQHALLGLLGVPEHTEYLVRSLAGVAADGGLRGLRAELLPRVRVVVSLREAYEPRQPSLRSIAGR